MKLGDIREQICVERTCDECGAPAKWRHTFLLDNCRNNPASSAYGRDDCSYCSDEDKYACDKHKQKVEWDKPNGMSWCATFSRTNREHLFLYWETK